MLRVFALSFILVSVGLASSLAAQGARSREADAVRAAELKRFEVMTKGDLAALTKILADDLTYTHSTGTLDNKEQFLESLRSGRVRYQSIEPGELQVRAYGNSAVINGRAKLVVISDGQNKNVELRFTDVWVKRSGRWQMVAWQSTRVP
jgi:ketosteroid isomerase-like protein